MSLVTADRNQPIGLDRNRSQKPIAITDRSLLTQSAYDLTQPTALYQWDRSHRSQTDRAMRYPIADPKIQIASNRKETTNLNVIYFTALELQGHRQPMEK